MDKCVSFTKRKDVTPENETKVKKAKGEGPLSNFKILVWIWQRLVNSFLPFNRSWNAEET